MKWLLAFVPLAIALELLTPGRLLAPDAPG